jgi:hypothetical protein
MLHSILSYVQPFGISMPCRLIVLFSQTCGGHGTLYSRVEHLLIAVPVVIAVSWIIIVFFVRALYYEFG